MFEQLQKQTTKIIPAQHSSLGNLVAIEVLLIYNVLSKHWAAYRKDSEIPQPMSALILTVLSRKKYYLRTLRLMNAILSVVFFLPIKQMFRIGDTNAMLISTI